MRLLLWAVYQTYVYRSGARSSTLNVYAWNSTSANEPNAAVTFRPMGHGWDLRVFTDSPPKKAAAETLSIISAVPNN